MEALLKPDERRRLEELLDESTPPRLRRRSQILLLYDEGAPTRQVAQAAGISLGRARYWRRRFRLLRMEVFQKANWMRSEQKDNPGEDASSETQIAEGAANTLVEGIPEAGWEEDFPETHLEPASLPASGSATHQLAEHTCLLALTFFDATIPLHGMGASHRRLLYDACKLPFAEIKTGKKKKPASILDVLQDWVHAHALHELNPQEERDLAFLVLLRNGKTDPEEIASIQPDQQAFHSLSTLAAILRIADALTTSQSRQTHIRTVQWGIGGLWVVVDGPLAAMDRAAGEKASRLWRQTGYPPVHFIAPEEADSKIASYPPLPQPLPATGMLADDPMSEAGRKVMRYHFAEMLYHEPGTRLGEDIEALHDMRVATRRMRAAFEIFKDAYDAKALKPHLKGLRATGRALGAVRDLDVLLERVHDFQESLPPDQRSGLEPLIEAWREQRERAREAMFGHLNSPGYQVFVQEFNLFLNTPQAGARISPTDPPTPDRVCEVAPVLIATRMASVRAFDDLLANASIEQLHALRIEFKKLRYAVEFFREVLGEEAKQVINDLKKMQDHLGDLNDANVAAHLLSDFLEQWDAQQAARSLEQRQNPEAIANYLADRYAKRHQLMASFQEAWDYFNRPEFRRNLALATAAL